ncbi:hypothetical protein HELRODRAFT_75483 [Helobdella robusta]|uniref:Regulation of nuclear pre-mRNA domain-containing protein 2 n=1 Tax=Helobdella robusta TaxID=6412 RepID=T1G257_HELRO|nr:hypothetical protein HELRODRAFT_75483 [Helobdella robusta]ESO07950.1 hypothetical protein HELRODRAFT_75483 [Helobdella robusta]
MTSGVSPKKIDESWVESKLRSANDSTECVQTLSLWALNHKSEHEQIVNIWLKVFKSADESQMVVLIYLCNDILQTCKRRNAVMFKESFKKALVEAVHFIKAEKAINSFKKILKVWSERNVFDEKYVEELNSLAFGQ